MASIPSNEDIKLLLKADCHRGSEKLNKGMAQYVYKKAADSKSHIFDLNKTWQKIHAAARLLVAVENPMDICLVSSTNWGKRSIFKFSQYTKSHSISGRFTPGTFTNQSCRSFREPTVLIVCDPSLDSQPIREASYVNVPVIACCDTDSSLEYVDIAIPCNNKSKFSVSAVFYLLCRELLKMRGEINEQRPWDVNVDLFIYKEVEELEKRINDDRLVVENENKRKREEERLKMEALKQEMESQEQEQEPAFNKNFYMPMPGAYAGETASPHPGQYQQPAMDSSEYAGRGANLPAQQAPPVQYDSQYDNLYESAYERQYQPGMDRSRPFESDRTKELGDHRYPQREYKDERAAGIKGDPSSISHLPPSYEEGMRGMYGMPSSYHQAIRYEPPSEASSPERLRADREQQLRMHQEKLQQQSYPLQPNLLGYVPSQQHYQSPAPHSQSSAATNQPHAPPSVQQYSAQPQSHPRPSPYFQQQQYPGASLQEQQGGPQVPQQYSSVYSGHQQPARQQYQPYPYPQGQYAPPFGQAVSKFDKHHPQEIKSGESSVLNFPVYRGAYYAQQEQQYEQGRQYEQGKQYEQGRQYEQGKQYEQPFQYPSGPHMPSAQSLQQRGNVYQQEAEGQQKPSSERRPGLNVAPRQQGGQ